MDNRESVAEFWRLRLELLDEWRGYAGGLGLGGICSASGWVRTEGGYRAARELLILSLAADSTRLFTSGAWWNLLDFVLLMLVMFRMMERLGEAAPILLVALLKLRESRPPTRACACPHRPQEEIMERGNEGANNTTVSTAPYGAWSFKPVHDHVQESNQLGRLTKWLGSIRVVSINCSPVWVRITYRTINSLTGVINISCIFHPWGIL